jgi:antitoxin component YwqK of YwqJK toxin-antitoxin module
MATTKKFYLFSRKQKEEANYNAEDKRDGITRLYYRNGVLKKEVIYKNGKKEGTEKEYSKNGILHLEISYKDGLRDGMYRAYSGGNLYREYTYKKGRKEGPARWLLKDGKSFEFECKDDREKIGRWKNYNQNGLLVEEKVYSSTSDLLCELFYEYEEYGRIVTIQWTRFLDDEIEKYRQKAGEYDERGNPEFPVSERKKYPPAEAYLRF